MNLSDLMQQPNPASGEASSSTGIFQTISSLLTEQGGLSGMIEKFTSNGLKETVMSWVSMGANHPISAEQINQVLGNETVKALALKLGIDTQSAAQKISEHLPGVIDKLTPEGQIPTLGSIASNIGSLAQNFLGGNNK